MEYFYSYFRSKEQADWEEQSKSDDEVDTTALARADYSLKKSELLNLINQFSALKKTMISKQHEIKNVIDSFNIKKLSYKELSKMYKSVDKDSILEIDWKKNKGNLLTLEKYWLPNTQEIIIKNAGCWGQEIMEKFLYTSIPNNQKGFSFNIQSNFMIVSDLIKPLKIACSKVTKVVWIWNVSLEK